MIVILLANKESEVDVKDFGYDVKGFEDRGGKPGKAKLILVAPDGEKVHMALLDEEFPIVAGGVQEMMARFMQTVGFE